MRLECDEKQKVVIILWREEDSQEQEYLVIFIGMNSEGTG